MSERVRTIRLYGHLGAKFGRVHQYVCYSARDALRALVIMVPGFEAELMSSKDRGVGYSVFLGKRNLDEKSLAHPVGEEDIRIAPAVSGRKSGFGAILAGVAIVAVTYFSAGVLSPAVVSALYGVGASLVLGGVSQMISRQGSTGTTKTSYYFSGAQNTTEQGGPVPVLYGLMQVGSTVISSGISAQDS